MKYKKIIYPLLILSIFSINFNKVDAICCQRGYAAPDSIKLTVRTDNFVSDNITPNYSVETYLKAGTVASEEGIHFYCYNKNKSAPSINEVLYKDKELSAKYAYFIENSFDNDKNLLFNNSTNNYAANQMVMWSLRGLVNAQVGDYFSSEKTKINNLKEDSEDSRFSNPTISFKKGKKKVENGYYIIPVTVTTSNLSKDYTLKNSGGPTGTIVTNNENGTTNKKTFSKSGGTIYIKVPVSNVIANTKYNIKLIASIEGNVYKAYSYCVKKDGKCDVTKQHLVPRRTFKETITSEKSKTISFTTGNDDCEVDNIQVTAIDYNKTSDKKSGCFNTETNWNYENDIEVNIKATKICGDTETNINITNLKVGTISETSKFKQFQNPTNNGSIWAGKAIKTYAELTNEITNNIYSEDTIKNLITTEINNKKLTSEVLDSNSVDESSNDAAKIISNKIKSAIEKTTNNIGPTDIYYSINNGAFTVLKTTRDIDNEINGKVYKKTISLVMNQSEINLQNGNVTYRNIPASLGESYYYTDINLIKNDQVEIKMGNDTMNNFRATSVNNVLVDASCSVKVNKSLFCTNGNCPGEPTPGKSPPGDGGSYNFYYRQIDLKKPFPKISYSNTNWKDYYGNDDNLKSIANAKNYHEYTIKLSDAITSTQYSLENIKNNGKSKLNWIKVDSVNDHVSSLGTLDKGGTR